MTPTQTHIAGRYRVVRSLGRGAIAHVYEVIDESNDTRLALKHLFPEQASRVHVRDLFQREFNTLVQLSHPLIVRVFDYGVDETPYYTMELISGESLRKLSPLPWREVCALMRDVASALSLVHSRRLVHRDVTHGNVYRTEDGHAKLFDFGALAPSGTAREIVGTPPFVPPEAVIEQRVDARSDLFSLGALAYFLLTERHAYPARRLSDLGIVWSEVVHLPSRFTPDIPSSLDELVVSLLSLNAVARPRNAAEVFDRLTAIAELPATEAPEVAQAYLSTPALVGRSDAIERFKRRLARIAVNRGASLVIEGAPGLGRSRLLSSFLLDAKLSGLLTIRADGESADDEPLTVARKLLQRLFSSDPVLVRDSAGAHAGLLAPLLAEPAPSTRQPAIEENRWPELVDALASLVSNVARVRPLAIGVDDFEYVDSASQSLLIRLAELSRKTGICLLVALQQDARFEAHELLRAASSALALSPLSEADTRALVCSLFGDVSHVEGVSQWVHRLSEGNPRTTLEVTGHLLDAGAARYEEGAWVLPSDMDGLALPSSVDQALETKIASLSADARRLAGLVALSYEREALLASEYRGLMPDLPPARLDAAHSELVSRTILVPSGPSFVFSHGALRDAARRSVPAVEYADYARGLARVYDAGPEPSELLAAYYFLEASDYELAFERAVRSVAHRAPRGRCSAFSRTPAGARVFDRLFEWGLAQRKPWPQVISLGRMLLQLAVRTESSLIRHSSIILDRLRQDSGLADWETLSHIEDPGERIRTAIGMAHARHRATLEAERGLHPRSAIEELTVSVAMLCGVHSRMFAALPSLELLALLEPFRPISNAVGIVVDVVADGAAALLRRNSPAKRQRCIEALSRPVEGIDELARFGMYWTLCYYEAMEEVALGHPEAIKPLEPVTQIAAFAPLGWQAIMVAALFQGDMAGAERAKQQRELSRLARFDVEGQIDAGVLYEASAYDILGDLLRLKQCVPWFEQRCEACPEMRPYYELHAGNCQRLRGELSKALAAYERAAALVPGPQVNGAWSYIVIRRAQALIGLERAADAKALCEEALELCRRHGIVWQPRLLIELTLAHALAVLGLVSEGVARAERVLAETEAERLSGILYVDTCSILGTIAQRASNDALLDRVIKRLEAMEGAISSFAMRQLHVLKQSRDRSNFEVVRQPRTNLFATQTSRSSVAGGVRTQIELCRGPSERSRKALEILIETAAANTGFLYLCHASGLTLAASSTREAPPAALEVMLSERLNTLSSEEDTTSDSLVSTSVSDAPPLTDFSILELTVQSAGRCVLIGLAALRPRDRYLGQVPASIRTALSEAFLTAGDTTGVLWA